MSVDTEELIERIKAGDKDAENELMRRFSGRVRAAAGKLARGNAEDAEDLSQAGLMAVAAAVKAYDPARGASFSTYAMLCARGRMIDEYRRVSRSRVSRAGIDAAENIPSALNIDDELIAKELAEYLPLVLTDFEHRVFALRLEGLKYKDIADTLGKSVKSVDNAMRRARDKVNEYLKK